jgi:hypothetical protein
MLRASLRPALEEYDGQSKCTGNALTRQEFLNTAI